MDLHGTYIGEQSPDLKGKTALLMLAWDGQRTWLMAQFDDVTVLREETRLGFNWHRFEVSEFQQSNL